MTSHERMCRAVCKIWGTDPDFLITEIGKKIPAWQAKSFSNIVNCFLAMREIEKQTEREEASR